MDTDLCCSSGIFIAVVSAITAGMLVAGSAFVIFHMTRLGAIEKHSEAQPRRAPRIISMIFPDLFPVEDEPLAHRVLCIDNSLSRLNLVKDLLEERGFEVWTARSVADAFDVLSHMRLETVVTEENVEAAEFRKLLLIQPTLSVVSASGRRLVPPEEIQAVRVLTSVVPPSRDSADILRELLASQRIA
jgi:CheY-like chemotaxis protein